VAAFGRQAAAHERWIDRLLAGISAEDATAIIDRLERLPEGGKDRAG